MRTQELLALEPRHISEDGSTIVIEQAVNMVKGTAVVGTPKSRDSYRVIPVPPVLQKYAIIETVEDSSQKSDVQWYSYPVIVLPLNADHIDAGAND